MQKRSAAERGDRVTGATLTLSIWRQYRSRIAVSIGGGVRQMTPINPVCGAVLRRAATVISVARYSPVIIEKLLTKQPIGERRRPHRPASTGKDVFNLLARNFAKIAWDGRRFPSDARRH
jgi:hypothetical protein